MIFRNNVILLLLIMAVSAMTAIVTAGESDQSKGADAGITVTALARQIAFVKSFSIAYPYQYPQKTQQGGNNPGAQNARKTRKK